MAAPRTRASERKKEKELHRRARALRDEEQNAFSADGPQSAAQSRQLLQAPPESLSSAISLGLAQRLGNRRFGTWLSQATPRVRRQSGQEWEEQEPQAPIATEALGLEAQMPKASSAAMEQLSSPGGPGTEPSTVKGGGWPFTEQAPASMGEPSIPSPSNTQIPPFGPKVSEAGKTPAAATEQQPGTAMGSAGQAPGSIRTPFGPGGPSQAQAPGEREVAGVEQEKATRLQQQATNQAEQEATELATRAAQAANQQVANEMPTEPTPIPAPGPAQPAPAQGTSGGEEAAAPETAQQQGAEEQRAGPGVGEPEPTSEMGEGLEPETQTEDGTPASPEMQQRIAQLLARLTSLVGRAVSRANDKIGQILERVSAQVTRLGEAVSGVVATVRGWIAGVLGPILGGALGLIARLAQTAGELLSRLRSGAAEWIARITAMAGDAGAWVQERISALTRAAYARVVAMVRSARTAIISGLERYATTLIGHATRVGGVIRTLVMLYAMRASQALQTVWAHMAVLLMQARVPEATKRRLRLVARAFARRAFQMPVNLLRNSAGRAVAAVRLGFNAVVRTARQIWTGAGESFRRTFQGPVAAAREAAPELVAEVEQGLGEAEGLGVLVQAMLEAEIAQTEATVMVSTSILERDAQLGGML